MKTHLIHGFNVSDGGKDTTMRWRDFFPGPVVHDYGWTGLLMLRWRNRRVVDELTKQVNSSDILVGHSNGALICWQIAQRVQPRCVVVVNPAMRRDTEWPEHLPVLCLYSSQDWVVQLGRMWSRLVSLGGIRPHGWGAAGRYGFTVGQPLVYNFDMANPGWPEPVTSHSGAFDGGYWGYLAGQWAVYTSAREKAS